MHIIFIPYGKLEEVELLENDMRAQKHLLPLTKGKKKNGYYIQGQVRKLPFGVYEYVCPKEDRDAVMTTLKFHLGGHGSSKTFKIQAVLSLIRKLLKIKPVPKRFDTSRHFLWITENVGIIPLGLREDSITKKKDGNFKGWTYENI